MYSLKRLVWLAFLVVGVMLSGVVLLGGYQWQMARQYTQVISENEHAIFHFMTIRESITGALIEGSFDSSGQIVTDIEKLNSELTRLKENRVVSPELKFALADKVDLTGLAILLRQVISDQNQKEKRILLQERLRSISDYLIQYDRIIAGQARARIVNFQMVVIGALGLIISLASFSLIQLYRNTVSPLLKLSQQLQSEEIVPGAIDMGGRVAEEIADLVEGIEFLMQKSLVSASDDSTSRDVELLLADAVNETTNRLNGIINYAQLLYDSSDAMKVSDEQREMLQKIIDGGVNIAREWQKLK